MIKKRCSVCREYKPLDQFSKSKAEKDGHTYRCKECNKAYTAEWRRQNPNAFKAWREDHLNERSAYYSKWLEANKDRRSKYNSKWLKENRDSAAARCATRVAIKLCAKPKWADDEKIKSIYRRSAELTRETGVQHQVDHIYPLQGKRVCGLHCESNLQILTREQNISKLNRMPEEWTGIKKTGRSL